MGYEKIVDQAACVDTDPELFFYDDPTFIPPEIRALCDSCPVRDLCLHMAVDETMDYGIYGGTTPAQRSLSRTQKLDENCPNGHSRAEHMRVNRIGRARCSACERDRARRTSKGVVAGVRVACRHGHPWVEENLTTLKDGTKRCQICIDARRTVDESVLSQRTECINNHPWPENLVNNGKRHWCAQCRRESQREYRDAGKRKSSKATSCSRGHEFSDDNTVIDSSGRRQCRQCKSAATLVRSDRASSKKVRYKERVLR